MIWLIFMAFIATSSGCDYYARNKVIVIQPLGSFPSGLTQHVYKQLKKINPTTIIRQPIALPAEAYYAQRKRYRADSLIRYLGRHIGSDTIVIGITDKDISTTKGAVADWGVMGLGYCPGRSCVVSTYRLSQKDLPTQFYKVAIHELGHTQGLPHCAEKTCFMRDAEGGNPLNEEYRFCASCKTYLTRRGWKLR